MDNNHPFNSAYTPYAQAQAQAHNGQQAGALQTSNQQSQQHLHHPAHQGLASFGSLTSQGHPQGNPSHPTLPPLQAHNAAFAQFGSMPYAQPPSQTPTPTTPHTPVNNSLPVSSSTVFPSHASPTNANGSMLPPAFPPGSFANAPSMGYNPPSTSVSAASASSSIGLPTLRPMPSGGVGNSLNGSLAGLSNGSHAGMAGAPYVGNEEAPTHVVGSQGRRGILPSAPGRPNPPAQGSAQATKSMIPQKDADGKFPCPHCNKTYLHAKHLKRHMLRHTGDRPYMCHLCKDTFSRSDILKRHFQKCSLRRGNPTGANHLAHQRRNTNGSNRLSVSQQDGPLGLAGLPEVAGQQYNAGGIANSPTVAGDMSARSSRANSLISPGTMSHRNSIAGLGLLGANGAPNDPSGTSAGYQPGMAAYAMGTQQNGAPMPVNYPFPQHPQMTANMYHPQQPQQHPPPQPMSFLGQQSLRFDNSQNNSSPHNNTQLQSDDGSNAVSSFDWNRMFTQGGQDGFIGSHPANASSQGNDHSLDNSETETKGGVGGVAGGGAGAFAMQPDFGNDAFLGNMYQPPPHANGFAAAGAAIGSNPPSFPNWSLEDPLQTKIDVLREHCFPTGVDAIRGDPAAEVMAEYLKLDTVKHFIEHYTSFQGHWPILHMATFRVTEASNNLLLAMLCIGAIYSPDPKYNVQQVRQMMEFTKVTLQRTSPVYRRVVIGHTQDLGTAKADVEELQALSMLQTIFTWHGTPAQRHAARADFIVLAKTAKALGLMQPAPAGHYAHSPLHATEAAPPDSQWDSRQWAWHPWLEQEKRNRLMYQVWVTDAALVIYFNAQPQFDPMDVRVMLPADDAAWEAASPAACASALGLNGAPAAEVANAHGTRRPIQPALCSALRLLLDSSAPAAVAALDLGVTNIYAKFLLVHALIVRVVACHRASLSQDGGGAAAVDGGGGATPATPLSQSDWLEQQQAARKNSANGGSGRATPTTISTSDPQQQQQQQHAASSLPGGIPQEKKRLAQALEKWKASWDADMQLQYPPPTLQTFPGPPKRFGFSRDAVHFYYLGRIFLQSQAAVEFTRGADARFAQVMSLLKRIKALVVNGDGSSSADLLGSVADIDDHYGLDTLTLDMTLLFKRYDCRLDSPVASVQTSGHAV